MNMRYFYGNRIENKKLKAICYELEDLYLGLGQLSSTMAVVSKAGSSASGETIKLCCDISCAIDLLINEVDKYQEQIENICLKLDKEC